MPSLLFANITQKIYKSKKPSFSSLVHFYWIYLVYCKYFVRDYLGKQFLVHNSTQSPSNFKFYEIFYILKAFFQLLIKIWYKPVALKFKTYQFHVSTILDISYRSNFAFSKLSTLLIGSFVTFLELTFWAKMSTFQETWIIVWSVDVRRKVFRQFWP